MSRASGFSLLELMLGIAVTGILAGFAVPAFSTLVYDSRRTAALNTFVTAIQLARSESIKRAEEVVLCKTGGGSRCTSGCNWEPGWLVFVNLDHDSPPKVDAGEPVIHQHGRLPGARVSANRDAFTFRPFSKASSNGTVTFCDARGPKSARAVIVSPSGRPRIAETNGSGGSLVCPAR
jgi:type IV fimbrial biogenesis protein FimT